MLIVFIVGVMVGFAYFSIAEEAGLFKSMQAHRAEAIKNYDESIKSRGGAIELMKEAQADRAIEIENLKVAIRRNEEAQKLYDDAKVFLAKVKGLDNPTTLS